ncbi:LysR family transcriptional regulator, partial [Atlantibacter subterraneus]|uniref:LysR family transcriptional regulator n=1 Tax=Atlantibacter subterraneus TaxID=255519 RepID=UPI002FDCAAEC
MYHSHGFIQKNAIIAAGINMELHQLRCFLVVAETLHFGQAAQRLDMLPSALGRHIRLLEESLGTPLFTR